jgi:hypothetical protein
MLPISAQIQGALQRTKDLDDPPAGCAMTKICALNVPSAGLPKTTWWADAGRYALNPACYFGELFSRAKGECRVSKRAKK